MDRIDHNDHNPNNLNNGQSEAQTETVRPTEDAAPKAAKAALAAVQQNQKLKRFGYLAINIAGQIALGAFGAALMLRAKERSEGKGSGEASGGTGDVEHPAA